MIDRGLQPDFSPAALAELARITGPVEQDTKTLRDLRGLRWASIDNDASLDLDQLSVCEKLPGGAVKILVAIADVDATVKAGSVIDQHAEQNTTSVYTPAEIFPMLPEKLSTNLTSLADQQDRAAIVVEVVVAPDGSIDASDVYRAKVRNQAKLAYDSVAAWLQGNAPAPEPISRVRGMDDQIRTQNAVAQKMQQLRHERGAIVLQTIEPQAVFDADMVVDFQLDKLNCARHLIEDLMIAANGAAGRCLERKGCPSFRRVVRSPENWPRIVEVAAELGDTLPPEPDSKALQTFLVKRAKADPLRFPDLSLVIVKLLGKGEYIVEHPGEPPIGHFGLAVKDYTHSTAPNRRFPDLVMQRLLKAAIAGQPQPYDDARLQALAAHCTQKESDASKVERQVRKSAAALLLQSRIGEHFQALVTATADKGTYVRVLKPPVEGRLVRGFEGLSVGKAVQVKLVATDAERGFIDFARA
jgi:exoribonuclease-2